MHRNLYTLFFFLSLCLSYEFLCISCHHPHFANLIHDGYNDDDEDDEDDDDDGNGTDIDFNSGVDNDDHDSNYSKGNNNSDV